MKLANKGPTAATKFFCEHHDSVRPFHLMELKTQVFDTYSICAGLLTTLSSSRFFFDNRNPDEFLGGFGVHTTISLSLMLQHMHILIASLCTAAGLEAMLVFVLCAMYSRSALAMPQVGAKVFEHFLKQTGKQRSNAFYFMLISGVVSSTNLVLTIMTMPSVFRKTRVNAAALDVASFVCATSAFAICCFTVHEVRQLLSAANIIFQPPSKLDEWVAEQEPLITHRGGCASPLHPGQTSPIAVQQQTSNRPQVDCGPTGSTMAHTSTMPSSSIATYQGMDVSYLCRIAEQQNSSSSDGPMPYQGSLVSSCREGEDVEP